MNSTPKSMRLHIGLFGRRNVGKSSLLNALTRQNISIVSSIAGTTTDPVEKAMELFPIGPVLWIDTAGIDDEGVLGEMRISKTYKAMEKTEVALLVTDGDWEKEDELLLKKLKEYKIPTLVVFNKIDIKKPSASLLQQLKDEKINTVQISTLKAFDFHLIQEQLIHLVPDSFWQNKPILGDLLNPGEFALLVIPIDKEAPKGRLIMPQVQAIRDLLDNEEGVIIIKENQIQSTLKMLKTPPALVVCDSQVFQMVDQTLDQSIPLTSFSILFARLKGDLSILAQGAQKITSLKPGDNVLIAEACAHHPVGEDIGRVKIPNWISKCIGGAIQFDTVQGGDFPKDLSSYKLVIHCGACTFNPKQMLVRISQCQSAGVPITNYGLAIAQSLGILERAVAPILKKK